MGFGHEKMDVYRAAIEYVAWVYSVDIDPDSDSDPDTDGNGEETDRQPLPRGDALQRASG
jgi:hypothetical protein